MKGILILLLWAVTTVCVAQTSYKVNSNGGLNLRENTGKDSKTITSLPDGTKVIVLDKSNEKWWKVKVDGKTGYVSSEFLKEDNSKNNSSTSQNQANNNNSVNTQKSRNTTSSNNSQNSPGTWAAGLRLGDPAGITIKKYLQRNRAFEINAGRTTFWGYNYKDRFYHQEKYKDFEYTGFHRRGAMSFQFHYLYNKDIASTKGLQWYLGFGPQLRLKSYSYQYKVKVSGTSGNDFWVSNYENVTDLDLGIDGIIGLEYKFDEIPFSIFGEANLFLEVVDRPALIGQGGLGLRFHF